MKSTIDMAREAGLEITVDPTETPWRTFVEGWEDQLKAFEALVRADEAEKYKWDVHSCGPTCTKVACAKVCDALLKADGNWTPTGHRFAAAIRARGETK